MNNRKSSRVEGVRQISVPNTSLYTCRCSRIRPECAYVHAHARNTYIHMYIIYVQAIYKYTWRGFLHRVLSFADYQLCGNEHVGDIIVDTSARTFLLLFDSILSNRILFLKQKCVANQVESVEESFAILSSYAISINSMCVGYIIEIIIQTSARYVLIAVISLSHILSLVPEKNMLYKSYI